MNSSKPSKPTAKRKADDSNPLTNIAKKSKRDQGKAGSSNKRKLANAEEQPGGLLIVRAPSTQQPSSQERFAHLPSPSDPSGQSSNVNGAHNKLRPAKKQRADSRNGTKATVERLTDAQADQHADNLAVENDVRAMDDEADHLRNSSRIAISTSSASQPNPNFSFPSSRHQSAKPKRPRVVDSSIPLPTHESPQIERNRLMRDTAMARYQAETQNSAGGSGDRPSGDESDVSRPSSTSSNSIHRRRSSISDRGKRISSIFESGIISRPHTQVSDSSFYKHIDFDIPEHARARQLLVWCASRYTTVPSLTASTSGPSTSKPDAAAQPKDPPVSDKAKQFLTSLFDDSVRLIADKKVPISTYAHASQDGPKMTLKENPQNASNRLWQVVYGDYIDRSKKENDSWNAVELSFGDYIKTLRAQREKQASTLSNDIALSTKAKGKQRAMDDGSEDAWWVSEDFEEGEGSRIDHSVSTARTVIAGSYGIPFSDVISSRYDERTRARVSRRTQLRAKIDRLEEKLDDLHAFTNTIFQATNVAEEELNQRFAELAVILPSIRRPPQVADPDSLPAMLNRYVPLPEERGKHTHEIFRALARVDHERPPARIGDAARRAVREVQRAGERGAGPVGERRLTNVPATPRKAPPTPRRGGTPGREK